MIINQTESYFSNFKKSYGTSIIHDQGDPPPPPSTLPVSEMNWDDFRNLGYNTDLWQGKVDISGENNLDHIPFPIDVFPPKLREYITKICFQLRKSIDFLGLAILVIAGSVIGKSRVLKLEEGFLIFANMFACLAGKSGSGKSPFINKAMEPLIDKLEPDFTYFLTHAYSTAIYKRLDENFSSKKKNCSLIFFKDELFGLLKTQNAKNGNEEKENFLSLFDGTSVNISRTAMEFRAKLGHPIISLIGGMVTSFLSALRQSLGEDGLLGRMFFAIPRTSPQGEWTEAEPDLAEHWVKILQSLDSLRLDTSTSSPQPRRILMNENARAIYRQIRRMFDTISNDKSIALGDSHYSILSKAPSHLGKLTLILTLLKQAEECVMGNHNIEQREIIVDGHTILDALKLLYYFHVNSFHVLHQIDYTSVQYRAKELFNFCKANGIKTISKSMAYSSRFRPISKCTDGDSAEKLFDAIESLGLGIKKHSPKNPKGGRPSTFIMFIFDHHN